MGGLVRDSLTVAAVALAHCALALAAPASDVPADHERRYSIQLDNDFFSGAHRDQDYSWGGAATYASPRPGFLLRPLHAARHHLDDWLMPEEIEPGAAAIAQQATQIGIVAMTPHALEVSEPLLTDRPYANLIYVTSSEIHVLEGGDSARFSSLTLGVLGLRWPGTVHRVVHRALGDKVPLGWHHQISDGGEPTLRYVVAQQWLIDNPAQNPGEPELKLTIAGSAGFLTEASLAFSARWGRIQSPWWSFDPELSDYTAAPVAPVDHFSSENPAEIFGFAGFRLKARAYNALLQGQFRHSDVRVQGDDLSRLLAEAWLGLATTWGTSRITYALHFTTSEMMVEPGKRSLIWAGIKFERSL